LWGFIRAIAQPHADRYGLVYACAHGNLYIHFDPIADQYNNPDFYPN
jgi:hypothetical protein